jgi:hypothetical protein
MTSSRISIAKNRRGNGQSSARFRLGDGRESGPGRGGLGPYSRAIDRGAVGGIIDGRSREGRFLRAYERQLTEHVGGSPSIVQRALINRAARLALHLELMDERALADGDAFTTHDHLHYVSWSNALGRLLVRLGIEGAAEKTPSLSQYLASQGHAA